MPSHRTVPVYAHGNIVGHLMIDASDYAFVMQWRWRVHKEGYAVRSSTKAENREHTILLHRELMKAFPGDNRVVDHINRNRLDCRRSNMRFITRRDSPQNQNGRKGSSRYRGVSWSRTRHLWIAQAKLHGRVRNLGGYATEQEAAAVAQTARLAGMKYATE